MQTANTLSTSLSHTSYGVRTLVALCAILFWGATSPVSAQDETPESGGPISFGVESDFASRYVWHGIPYSENSVHQNTLWASAVGFTAAIWTNFVLGDGANHGKVDEVDFVISRAFSVGVVSVEPSFCRYHYPNQAAVLPTSEIGISASAGIGPISVTSNHSYDVEQYSGSYFGDIGLSVERAVAPQWTFSAETSLGWGSSDFTSAYLGIDGSSYNLATVAAAMEFRPVPAFYLKPHLALTAITTGVVKDVMPDPSIVTGGLAIGLEF